MDISALYRAIVDADCLSRSDEADQTAYRLHAAKVGVFHMHVLQSQVAVLQIAEDNTYITIIRVAAFCRNILKRHVLHCNISKGSVALEQTVRIVASARKEYHVRHYVSLSVEHCGGTNAFHFKAAEVKVGSQLDVFAIPVMGLQPNPFCRRGNQNVSVRLFRLCDSLTVPRSGNTIVRAVEVGVDGDAKVHAAGQERAEDVGAVVALYRHVVDGPCFGGCPVGVGELAVNEAFLVGDEQVVQGEVVVFIVSYGELFLRYRV